MLDLPRARHVPAGGGDEPSLVGDVSIVEDSEKLCHGCDFERSQAGITLMNQQINIAGDQIVRVAAQSSGEDVLILGIAQ